jgi:hypothetical protein
VGYDSVIHPVKLNNSKTESQLQLKTVVLHPVAVLLQNIMINSKSWMRRKNIGNTLQILIGDKLRSQPINTMQLLKTLPDVSNRDELTIRGMSVIEIFLHNKDSGYGIVISQNRLSTIPLRQVRKIEVDYDRRVVHIYLTSLYETGQFIEVRAGGYQGKKTYSDGSLTYKFNKNRLTSYSYAAINYVNRINRTDLLYKVNVDSSEVAVQNKAKLGDENLQASVYTTLEYELNKRSRIGFLLDANKATIHQPGTSLSSGSNAAITSYVNNTTSFFYAAPTLYYQWAGDSGRRRLSIDAGVITNNATISYDTKFITQKNDSSFNGKSLLTQNSKTNVYTATTNLILDYKKKGVLTVRSIFTSTVSAIPSVYLLQTFNSTTDSTFNQAISEIKWATNAGWQKRWGKSWFSNVQTEYTYYKISNLITNSRRLSGAKPYHFFGFNISATRTVKPGRSITFFTANRITPPNFRSFFFKSVTTDGTSFINNNPAILPYQSFQAGASYPVFKNVNLTVFYQRMKDRLMSYPQFTINNVFLGSQLINVERSREIVISANFTKEIGDKWYISLNTSASRQYWRNTRRNFPVQLRYFSATGNGAVYYTGSKGFSANTNIFFISGQLLANELRLRPYAQWDFGAAQQVGKKVQLFTNINNAFNFNQIKIRSAKPDLLYRSSSQLDLLYVQLGIILSFDKKFVGKYTDKKSVQEQQRKRINSEN